MRTLSAINIVAISIAAVLILGCNVDAGASPTVVSAELQSTFAPTSMPVVEPSVPPIVFTTETPPPNSTSIPLPAVSASTVSPIRTKTASLPTSIPAILAPTQPPVPTSTSVPTCEIPGGPEPVARPEHVVSGVTNELIVIDGLAIFELDPGDWASWQWEQQMAAPDSRDYMSQHAIILENETSASVTTIAAWPGNYRLSLTVTSTDGSTNQNEVSVNISDGGQQRLQFRALNMTDLFEQQGESGFNLRREDPECQAKMFAHAFDVVTRTNSNWIVIVPANFQYEVGPKPKFAPPNNALSLTDDDFYKELIDAAHVRGVRVMQMEQEAPGLDLTPGEIQQIWEYKQTSGEWWDGWFDEWHAWSVERAARAEKFGVDAFAPFNWTNFTARPEIYPDYARRWEEMIADIREVFSGDIVVTVNVWASPDLTYIDAADVVLLGTAAAFFNNHIDDPEHPRMGELLVKLKEWFSDSKPQLAGKVPVYIYFSSTSSNGQIESEDLIARTTYVTDFQEQALYLEAFFAAVSEEPWISGTTIGVADWFDQYERSEEFAYFDLTNQASPRSKPAEQVIALWYEPR